jgi:hypothetical protein
MATAAAAIIAKARRDIQHEFFSRDAVSAERAIDFDPSRHVQRRVFGQWQQAGMIQQRGDGRFWLDVAAYDTYLRGQHRRVRAILLVLIVLLAIGAMTGLFASGGHGLANGS